MRRLALALFALAAAMPAPADAQTLGTFSWQLQPYCNVLSLTVTQVGGAYRVEGVDASCGGTPASVVGMAFPDAAGVSFGLTLVPNGATPVHVRAAISLATLSGTWSDSGGLGGTFAFGASTPGSPRPAPPAPAQVGATVVQVPGGSDRVLSARLTDDTGGTLGDGAAVYGQFGDASNWFSPGTAGVRGDSRIGRAVVGSTDSGTGVTGMAGTGIGVYGYSQGGGTAVYGYGHSTARGVLAAHEGGGTALEVRNGAIRVSGTTAPAFVHQATAGNIASNSTIIDHPLVNDDPNALLIVTQNWSVANVYNDRSIGVYYTGGRWRIFNQNGAAMPLNAAFNVLVIKR